MFRVEETKGTRLVRDQLDPLPDSFGRLFDLTELPKEQALGDLDLGRQILAPLYDGPVASLLDQSADILVVVGEGPSQHGDQAELSPHTIVFRVISFRQRKFVVVSSLREIAHAAIGLAQQDGRFNVHFRVRMVQRLLKVGYGILAMPFLEETDTHLVDLLRFFAVLARAIIVVQDEVIVVDISHGMLHRSREAGGG